MGGGFFFVMAFHRFGREIGGVGGRFFVRAF